MSLYHIPLCTTYFNFFSPELTDDYKIIVSEGAILNEELMGNTVMLAESKSSETQNLVKKIKKLKTNTQDGTANKEVKKLLKKKKIVKSATLKVPTTTTTYSPSYPFQTELPLNRSNEDSRCEFLIKNKICFKQISRLFGKVENIFFYE